LGRNEFVAALILDPIERRFFTNKVIYCNPKLAGSSHSPAGLPDGNIAYKKIPIWFFEGLGMENVGIF
jgi:hypothetical protein